MRKNCKISEDSWWDQALPVAVEPLCGHTKSFVQSRLPQLLLAN